MLEVDTTITRMPSLPPTWEFIPGMGFKLGMLKRRELPTITHIVVHTTGVGIYSRRKGKLENASDVELANHVYTKIMKDSGHFVIGASGKMVQYVPFDYAARHVGSGLILKGTKYTRYFKKKKVSMTHMPAWWGIYTGGDTQHPAAQCLEAAWRTGSCNDVSIGIEVCIPENRTGFLPDNQVYGIEKLIQHIATVIPSIKWVTSHCLVHPLARTSKGHPYDMLPHQYAQIQPTLPYGIKKV